VYGQAQGVGDQFRRRRTEVVKLRQYRRKKENGQMLFLIYAILAVATIVAYYTGWLTRNNLEWLVYVFAVTILPAILWL
jgi:hypothetical protein